jgi:predicted short-subunit dehydrogenase-like oxidoreductase (DUF2520 family)
LTEKLNLGFIGAGTVGTALAVKLSSQGDSVPAVSSPSHTSAVRLAKVVKGCKIFSTNQEVANNANLIFITTPDDVIASVANEVKWHQKQSVVHCSGADSTISLQPARDAGANVGVIHPLQTFASVDKAIENMPGSTFALEAEEPLISILKQITNNLGGNWITLKAQDKVIYHAAAVIACNYLITLVKLATDLWGTFNVPTQQATQELLPLIRGTLHNIETVGIPQCLTGPIARGDIGTIKKHLTAIQELIPEVLTAYQELGRHTIPIAISKGKINQAKAEELYSVFKQYS